MTNKPEQQDAPETARNQRINKLSADLWEVFTCDIPDALNKNCRVWDLLLAFDETREQRIADARDEALEESAKACEHRGFIMDEVDDYEVTSQEVADLAAADIRALKESNHD